MVALDWGELTKLDSVPVTNFDKNSFDCVYPDRSPPHVDNSCFICSVTETEVTKFYGTQKADLGTEEATSITVGLVSTCTVFLSTGVTSAYVVTSPSLASAAATVRS